MKGARRRVKSTLIKTWTIDWLLSTALRFFRRPIHLGVVSFLLATATLSSNLPSLPPIQILPDHIYTSAFNLIQIQPPTTTFCLYLLPPTSTPLKGESAASHRDFLDKPCTLPLDPSPSSSPSSSLINPLFLINAHPYTLPPLYRPKATA